MVTYNKSHLHLIALLLCSVIFCIAGCSSGAEGQRYGIPTRQPQKLSNDQQSSVKGTNEAATVRFEPESAEAPQPGSQGSFVDEQHAWVVVDLNDIRRTVDGGRTWQRMRPAAEFESAFKWLSYMPVSITFITPTRGWLTGNESTWQTNDGGVTWRQIFSGSSSGLCFADAEHGWRQIHNKEAGYQSYVTQDGGATWQSCGTARNKGQVPDTAYFITRQLGWAITSHTDKDRQTVYGVARTTDGGCHWQQLWVSHNSPDERYSDIHFISEREGWLTGEYRLYHTTDGGKMWQEVLLPTENVQIASVYFSDPKNGWVITAPKSDDDTGVYRTADGGKTWWQLTRSEMMDGKLPAEWKTGKLLQMLYASRAN